MVTKYHASIFPFRYASYTPRQDVRPKVVATAVRMVMTMFRIFPQSDLFSIVYLSYEL